MHILVGLVLSTLLAQSVPTVVAQDAPYQRTLVITAYYSPLPGQCCYVKGSLEADKILNGNGTHGADGTPVYPGMAAAPSSYAFGTRIKLPGIGVVTVHDRGGAILEGTQSDRLDLWVGHGEEGLARALAFGKQTVTATVYPKGTSAPAESLTLASLPSPLTALKPFAVPTGASSLLSAILPAYGEKGDTVSRIQEQLKAAGYFAQEVTGFYGDVTKSSVLAFLGDIGLGGDGHSLSATGALYLTAAAGTTYDEALIPFATPESTPSELASVRRILRHLGYYKGRTVGPYDETLRTAIIAFQRDRGLVMDAASPGAGRVGPLTRGKMAQILRTKRIARKAERLLLLERVRSALIAKNLLPAAFAQEGEKGDTVKVIQRSLAMLGFFPAQDASGFFGPLTRESVLAYQLKHKLVKDDSDTGAGRVGPSTLKQLQDDAVATAARKVNAYGWAAL